MPATQVIIATWSLFAVVSCCFRAGYKLQCCRKPLPLPATLLATSRVPINSTPSDSAHGHCWQKQPSVCVSQWHDKLHGRACSRAWAWGAPRDLNPSGGLCSRPAERWVSPTATLCQYFTLWIFADKEREEGRVGSCSTKVGCHRATEPSWDVPRQTGETETNYCLWSLNTHINTHTNNDTEAS